MTPLLIGGNMLANLINQHALADAQSGNWAAVASTLNAQTITVEGLRISGKQTIVGLMQAGRDPDAIRLKLEATPSGRSLLDLLPSVGVNWVDQLTLAVLAKNSGDGKLSQADVDALKSLSNRTASLASQQGFGTVTAEQCQRVWIVASCIGPISQTQAAAAAKLNNAQASLGPEHTDGLTLDELQTLCDAIIASDDGTV